MQNWTIDFQGMDGTRKLRGSIEERIAELAHRYGATSACRVIVKGPQASKRSRQHELDIHLTLADGSDITIGRSQRSDKRYEEIGFAIDDTFRRARRRLKDHSRGKSAKNKQRKRRSGAQPAALPGAHTVAPDAVNQKGSSVPAEAAASYSPLPAGPAELPEPVVSDDALGDRDKPTRDVGQEPPAAEAAADQIEEPAFEPDAAADQREELTRDVGQEPPAAEAAADQTEEPAFEPDAVADQRAELTRDVGQEPPAAEAAADETEEPAFEPDAAADQAAETAPECAEVAAVSPSAEPAQAPNLNPLFVALAVGTALTAAATLNASATWARLLKSATEGQSSADTDLGEASEARPEAGRDLRSRSE